MSEPRDREDQSGIDAEATTVGDPHTMAAVVVDSTSTEKTPQRRSESPQPASNAAGAHNCKYVRPDIEEQDPPLDVNDSDYDDDDDFDGTDTHDGSSATVRTSILEHEYESGRRYHHYRHGRYPFPNDDIEQEREYLKHVTHMEITGGKLFNSPIGSNPQRIMDLCTGTGLWAMDVAKLFPSAEVVGVDLSPIQPLMVPPNVRFLVDDVEDDWLDHGGYDLIHLRHSAIYLKNVQKVMRNSYHHLKPGGWFEITDYCTYIRCDDGSMPDGYPTARCSSLMHESLVKYGMDPYIANYHEEKLKEAGFCNIQVKVTKVPIGPWAKDPSLRVIGIYLRDSLHEFVSALSAKPLRNLGWSDAELEVFLAEVRRALFDKKVHSYVNFISFWAQRANT